MLPTKGRGGGPGGRPDEELLNLFYAIMLTEQFIDSIVVGYCYADENKDDQHFEVTSF